MLHERMPDWLSKSLRHYRNKRVLIVGAGGYLGAGLMQFLQLAPCTIVALTHRAPLSLAEEKKKQIKVVRGDIIDKNIWPRLLKDIDIIFFMAAYEYSKFDPMADVSVNSLSMLHLLEYCRKQHIRPKIVFASSSNLVGAPSKTIIDETEPDNPLTMYAVHKLLSEQYLRLYSRQFGIPSVSLRLANVYGPAPHRRLIERVVVNKIIANALRTGAIQLFKNRNCIRDYIFIDDAIAAFVCAGAAQRPTDGSYMLVGSGTGQTFRKLASTIARGIRRKTGKVVSIKIDRRREISPVEWRSITLQTKKLRRLTGWKAREPFEKGIEKTIEYILK